MDDVDKKIIMLLNDNSRMTATEIGKIVYRSRVAVSKRIEALLSSGEIVAFSLIRKRSNNSVIFEIVLKQGGRCETLIPKFRKLFYVNKAWSVTGSSDLLIWSEAKSSVEVHDMRDYLLNQTEVLTVTSHSIVKTFE